MGEILLIFSVITLVLLVLFIQKKKEQDRQYNNLMRKRSLDESNKKRYSFISRDDSAVKKRSPLGSAGDSTLKYNYSRQRYNSMKSPRDNLYYDRFDYNRRYDNDYPYNQIVKNCTCDQSSCRCYNQFSRSYCTPNNYNYSNINDKENFHKMERRDSYFQDLKSDNKVYPIDRDNYQVNKTNLNAVNNNVINEGMLMNKDNCSINQQYSNQNSFLNNKNNYLSNAPNNYNNASSYNNFNLANSNIIPGFKIIKLEDFLEKEKRDCSPMYKKKNEITLDEVQYSLIKFIKNEEDRVNICKSPEKIKELTNNVNNVLIKSKIFDNINCNNNQQNKPSNVIKSEESFLDELIPKKIDFSLINDTDCKQKLPQEIQISTPLAKKSNAGFDSFGDNNEGKL